MYRLSGTRKRKRSKCYKDSKRHRETITQTTVMMILRVYAMWSQSKRILCVLLLIYVSQVIMSFVFTGIFDTGSSKTYVSGMS